MAGQEQGYRRGACLWPALLLYPRISAHPATAPLAAMRTPALARAAIWEEALAACCPRVLWGCVLSDLGWTHMYFPLQVCQVSLQVKAAWNVLAAREGWDKLPVYALGASSGAAMVRA